MDPAETKPTPREELQDYLNKITPLPGDVLTEYTRAWTPWQAGRKEMITTAGQVQRHIYFVLQGVQKSYYLGPRREHIIAFTYAPSFTGIPESFYQQRPSRFYLECITPSQFLRLDYTRHQELLERYSVLDRLFRIGAEQLISGMVQRQYELLALDMQGRFDAFISRSPHLLKWVAHKDLASYLHIDPTNFSKLLKNHHP